MKALEKLKDYPSDFLGIDVTNFRSAIEACLAGAEAMRAQGAFYEVDNGYFPTLMRISS